MAEKQYEPWVAPLREHVKENTKDFPVAERDYFRGLVDYEIYKGNQSEAEALALVISEINQPENNVKELSSFLASVFQQAGKTAIVKRLIKK